ncbi:PREDICTED: potassium/sodium hyperpolarization-activated cyclic nucleotide-gated channel 1-like [Polistes dominula]|uniref:Potassium/sodium hyperpolarization-activated cyclic nucleotide-gated channel 1-like n=1 Tax=Polistes dominula TaxID=743375 RepID=A0ABM1I3U0_POLDO|nr:PREDICTED: potassium/sodium hyperpolarization-activated cyclic nucleotide-gated channel 1-like [Polistes dominula]
MRECIHLGMFKRQLGVHICELPKVSDSNLPKLPPNANIFTRWKRSYTKLILVSAKHPLTSFSLRSRAAITFEKRRHGRSLLWWIIHPYSTLRFFWDLLMIITYLYIFIMVPYIMTFHRIAKNTDTESWIIVYPAYVVCIIDIFLNFITGYVSTDGNEIFLNPVLIARIFLSSRNYIKRYFFIDLVSSIPYTWFYKQRILPPGPNSNSIFLLLEILPVLKIIRLGTLYHYLRQLNITFGCSPAKKIIIWLIIQTLLIFHWSSCLSYLFPYIVMHIIGDSMENSGTYLMHTGLYKQSDWIIYLESLHIGLSNLIGFNFVEFQSFGTLDKIAHCILLTFGKGYMICTIGKYNNPFLQCIIKNIVLILQLFESLAESELKYHEIIHGVKNYVEEKKLPKHLQNKLLNYYEYRFQGHFFKEQAISNTLSNHLNQEIMIHSSYGLLDTAKILRNLPPIVLRNLIAVLKPVIYMETDVIYKYHEEGDCMYFIANGTVALITFWGKEICHLESGDHFGAEVLLNSQKRRYESVLALEVCELLRLDRQNFKLVAPRESELFNRIEKDTMNRIKLIEKLEKLHLMSEQTKNENKEREKMI